MNESDFIQLGQHIADKAYSIFMECGAEHDFGYQGNAVFGSTNRIVLTERGFRIELSHCTKNFINEWFKINETIYWKHSK